jgi:hypothetical protein
MPKKKLNIDLVNDYINKIKKEKKVSEGTIKTYIDVGKNLSFSITTSQNTIIKKLKELYTNPNTIQLYLNLIILVRRDKGEETDKLIKFRNSLRDKIIKERKDNLKDMNDNLPSYETIEEELNNMNTRLYIINYLMLHHFLRNKDLNLKYVNKKPSEKNENYIQLKNNKAILFINDYKTEKTHGEKKIDISNERFIKELKDMNLKDGDYILPKKDGSKINNISTFNEKILKNTIMKLGQNKISKIGIKELLNKKDFKKLENASRDRGTSIEVLLKSYNLYNV